MAALVVQRSNCCVGPRVMPENAKKQGFDAVRTACRVGRMERGRGRMQLPQDRCKRRAAVHPLGCVCPVVARAFHRKEKIHWCAVEIEGQGTVTDARSHAETRQGRGPDGRNRQFRQSNL